MTSRPQNARRSGPAYAFGKFTITPEGFLLREGAEVLLRPKAFDVLLYLVERHGHVVTKQELLGALWNDAAVTDNSLAQCLVEIRRALDDHSQQVIRTIARRGYLFAAPVSYPLEEARRSIASPPAIEPIEPRTSSWRLRWNRRGAGIAAAVVAALAFFALRPSPPLQSEAYTQITSYTDSAVAPALSLDGRMLAFIRSSTAFLTPDQIYVKLLPDGEAVQLTQDPRPKYGPAFSPDGLQIAYTAADGAGWHTYTISALGGESHLLMDNAAGLSWLDEKHVLFSQIRAGLHMGIVAGTRDRREIREVYFPPHERSMAHYSYPSPDRKWAIVVEMDSRPAWQPCRLIPLDGSTPGALAGPNGPCTSAAWSPDGRWMYFAVDVKGARHLWRQRFPHGVPEPITSGPAEEDGVAVMPDGRSLITSIGMRQSALWLHDTTGDRALTTEGSVMSSLGSYSSPSFSADGKSLYYVLKRSPTAQAELWVADIDSGGHQPVLTAMPVIEYDVSNNGTEVVFSTENSKGLTELWRAPVDRSREPSPLGALAASSPHFGSDDRIVFRWSDGAAHYLAQIRRDGTGQARMPGGPISTILSISPDRRILIALAPDSDRDPSVSSFAIPLAGGPRRRICRGLCTAGWSRDGRFFYVETELASRMATGQTIAIPLAVGAALPEIPPDGFTGANALSLPGAVAIGRAEVVIGPDPTTYAYVQSSVHRNLFSVPLR